MTDEEETAMTNDELTEVIARRIARDRYRYNMDGQPLSDEWRDKYAETSWHEFVDQAKSALAVAKPEIERALLEELLAYMSKHYDDCISGDITEWAVERGIGLEEKT